jgi:hypothetical protein
MVIGARMLNIFPNLNKNRNKEMMDFVYSAVVCTSQIKYFSLAAKQSITSMIKMACLFYPILWGLGRTIIIVLF